MADSTEWLSLQAASQVLGVHPATLRAWADRGRIAAQRTPGGHRRFSRADQEVYAAHQRQRGPEAELLVHSALGRMRMDMSRAETSSAAWMTRFDEPMRQRYRETGRQLLGLLLRYISGGPEQQANALEGARRLGHEYARTSREHGLTLADSVQAVLFFHTSLTSSVVQMASSISPSGNIDWAATHRRVTEFVNDVLLAMVKAYTGEA
jgi:excisionase family DNA binding protein